jgi:hypothetical protein
MNSHTRLYAQRSTAIATSPADEFPAHPLASSFSSEPPQCDPSASPAHPSSQSTPSPSAPTPPEAESYLRSLAHLSGTVVLEFFGLYRSDHFAMLVLEDGGCAIDSWCELDDQERLVSLLFFRFPCGLI